MGLTHFIFCFVVLLFDTVLWFFGLVADLIRGIASLYADWARKDEDE